MRNFVIVAINNSLFIVAILHPLKIKFTFVFAGSASYKSAFQADWTTEWPFIVKGTTASHFWCSTCCKEACCDHQGKHDVECHILTSAHPDKVKALKDQQHIETFTRSMTDGDMSTLEYSISFYNMAKWQL